MKKVISTCLMLNLTPKSEVWGARLHIISALQRRCPVVGEKMKRLLKRGVTRGVTLSHAVLSSEGLKMNFLATLCDMHLFSKELSMTSRTTSKYFSVFAVSNISHKLIFFAYKPTASNIL